MNSRRQSLHLREARESDIPASPSNGFYEAFGAERLYSDRGEFHGGEWSLGAERRQPAVGREERSAEKDMRSTCEARYVRLD
jgi:hypothetical protein